MTTTTTDFGFQKVNIAEKASLVKSVFDNVASSYDVMNDAMSLGVHRLWKREFISQIEIRPDRRFLDVAGGTGDIARQLLQKGASHVTISDINEQMLREGRKRFDNENIIHNVDWLCANAESMPVPDASYHTYTIAFGIRNVTHIDKVLAEAYRLLQWGGRFLCLEFSQVTNPLFARLYDSYSFHVIPKMGEIIAKDRDSYQYLVESIRKFPAQEPFADMLRKAGFSQVSYRNVSGGVVAIHSGYKIG